MAPGVVGAGVAAVAQLGRSICLLQGSRPLELLHQRRLHRRIPLQEALAPVPVAPSRNWSLFR